MYCDNSDDDDEDDDTTTCDKLKNAFSQDPTWSDNGECEWSSILKLESLHCHVIKALDLDVPTATVK